MTATDSLATRSKPISDAGTGMDAGSRPALRHTLGVWSRLALLSFGSPAVQLVAMHRILVEEKRWISEARFLNALNYSIALPGPETQLLATYVGWLMHRVLGGIVAGGLFILPGMICMMAVSYGYAAGANSELGEALLFGVKPAVLVIVLQSLLRIARRFLRTRLMTVLAALAFIGTFFFNLSFAIVVIGAVLLGLSAGLLEVGNMLGRAEPVQPFRQPGVAKPPDEKDLLDHTRPSAARLLWTLVLWLALWFVPLITLIVILGWEDIYSRIAILLSEMAALSVGGPYAVNTYVATQAVAYGWLTYGEALDGLALAELVPGPVIQFLQFVGFTAAYRHPGVINPVAGAALAGLLTVWFTFIPTFLWIFLIAPFIEVFRNNKIINAMLSAVTGGLLGVFLTFALRFGNRTLFADFASVTVYGLDLSLPRLASVDPWALAITIAAAIATFRFKLGIVPTLVGAGIAGIAPYVLAAPEIGSLYSGLLGFAAGAAIGFPVGPVAVWCLHLRAQQRHSMVSAIIAGSVIGDVVVAAGFFIVIDLFGGVFASLRILHNPVIQGPILILSGIALLYVVNRSAVLGLPRQNEGREQKWIYVGTSLAFVIALSASVTHPENLLAIGSVFAILGIGSDSGLIVLAGFFLGTLTTWFSAIELLYRLGESQGRRIMRHVMQALCVMCVVAGLVQLGRGLGLL